MAYHLKAAKNALYRHGFTNPSPAEVALASHAGTDAVIGAVRAAHAIGEAYLKEHGAIGSPLYEKQLQTKVRKVVTAYCLKLPGAGARVRTNHIHTLARETLQAIKEGYFPMIESIRKAGKTLSRFLESIVAEIEVREQNR